MIQKISYYFNRKNKIEIQENRNIKSVEISIANRHFDISIDNYGDIQIIASGNINIITNEVNSLSFSISK